MLPNTCDRRAFGHPKQLSDRNSKLGAETFLEGDGNAVSACKAQANGADVSWSRVLFFHYEPQHRRQEEEKRASPAFKQVEALSSIECGKQDDRRAASNSR